MTFASTVGAFGFNLGASNEDWLLEAFDASNNLLDSYLLPLTWWQNDGEFFGLAADGIVTATLTQMTHNREQNADHIMLDNFTYAASATTTTSVPEPGILLLLTTGLAWLGFANRKSK